MLASTSGMLYYKIIDGEKTNWQSVKSSFCRVSLGIKLSNCAHYIRVHDDTSPNNPDNEIKLDDVKQYFLKTEYWHELINSNDQQTALYLVGDGVTNFSTVLLGALRTLGKYDESTSPRNPPSTDNEDHYDVIQTACHPLPCVREPEYLLPITPVRAAGHEAERDSVITKPPPPPPPRRSPAEASKSIFLPSPPSPPPPQPLQPREQDSKKQGARVPDFWECPKCTLLNRADASECTACESWRCPGQCELGSNYSDRPVCTCCGAWRCKACSSVNFRSSAACVLCSRR